MPFTLTPDKFPTLSLVFFIVFATCLSGRAQQNNDSLQRILVTATDTTEINVLVQIAESLKRLKPDSSLYYGQRALEKAENTGFKPGIVRALHVIGMAYGYKNDYATTIDYMTKSADLAVSIELWQSAANDYMNIGSAYAIEGDQEKWLAYYLKALALFEKIKDKKGMASVLYGIGNSLSSEKKYDQALENYRKSIEYFEELNEKNELPKVYVNIAELYSDMEDYPQALLYYNKALDGFNEFKNTRGRATALQYRGNTYFRMQKYDLALDDLNHSIEIATQTNHQLVVVQSLILMGKVQQARKQYDLAIAHLLEALPQAKKIKSKNDLGVICQLLSELYQAKGDYKNAFEFQGLHAAYYDSTFNTEKSKQIQEMQFRFESEKKEKEIVILKRDQFISKIYFAVSLTAVIFLLAIGFLINNRQKLRIQKDRELSNKENQILEERKSLIEAELLNRQLTEEQLRAQIDFHNKELTSYALNLIQKNELLDNIKEGIEEIRSAETDQVKSKLQSLLNTVNFSFHLDKDWTNFRLHFEQVHQSFFDKLHEQYPDLGPNDIKLCALIRLNLDTKAMATVLDISPESAKVARHRLRKKLGLVSEQNLASFLSKL